MTSRTLAAVTAALLVSTAATRADVEISSKPTSNMSCDSGVCTATAQKAVLNVADLANMLATGDVTVKTGALAKDIAIDQPLTWSSTARLTLDAQQSVMVKKQVTVAGQGVLTVTTNDTGGGKAKSKTGEFIIVPEHGSVQFWDVGSSLIVDSNSYTLVDDIKTLASDIAANPSGFYALAKPYDASVDGTYAQAPVNILFEGTFEGLGNEITSLSIKSNGDGFLVALFGASDSPAALRHIGIVRADVSASNANGIGLLAGNNFGRVVGCWASGQISFSSSVGAGGLVSENDGSITNSYADVRIFGSYLRKAVGGLVNFNDKNGTIASSYAFRSVVLRNSSETKVGGLVGESFGTIENSFARTRVIAGRQELESSFGGLVGENYVGAQIKSSYAAGETKIKSAGHAGGLIGEDDSAAGNVQHAYWNLDMGISNPSQGAGNIPNDPGITGLTTAQFQSKLPKGFDAKIWGSNPKINGGYPYLLANPPR